MVYGLHYVISEWSIHRSGYDTIYLTMLSQKCSRQYAV